MGKSIIEKFVTWREAMVRSSGVGVLEGKSEERWGRDWAAAHGSKKPRGKKRLRCASEREMGGRESEAAKSNAWSAWSADAS